MTDAENFLAQMFPEDKARSYGSFSYVSDLDKSELDTANTMAEYALQRVQGLFPEMCFTPTSGHWPVLLFKSQHSLCEMFAEIAGPDAQELIVPGGVWISSSSEYPGFFLMPFSDVDTLDGALAHELIHAALDNYATPRWFEEGLAMSVECAMGHSMHPYHDAYAYQRIKKFFAQHDPAAFISDRASFTHPQTSEFAYSLSQLMVSCLLHNRQAFAQMLETYERGNNGLKSVYGLTEEELATQVLMPAKSQSWISRLIYKIFAFSST